MRNATIEFLSMLSIRVWDKPSTLPLYSRVRVQIVALLTVSVPFYAVAEYNKSPQLQWLHLVTPVRVEGLWSVFGGATGSGTVPLA